MWKNIEGFENIYLINEYGTIKSLKTGNIMKPYLTNKGYNAIDLSKDGKKYKFLIHRLVALNFVPNPDNYPIVLHLDNDKLNCHYTNLKWGTYSENNSQAIRDGLNSVPRPDNRKHYMVYNDSTSIVLHDVNGIIENGNYGTESIMRNVIFRNEELKGGKFKGCHIKQIDIIEPIRFIR